VDFLGPVVHTTRGYSEDASRGFMGDVVAKESRGFLRRVAEDSGALWYIELAVLFRRCSRGFSHTAAYGVRGFTV